MAFLMDNNMEKTLLRNVKIFRQLKTLETPFILSNFSDHQFNINFIKIFSSRLNTYVNFQSQPTYLQNLSLLL